MMNIWEKLSAVMAGTIGAAAIVALILSFELLDRVDVLEEIHSVEPVEQQ